MSENTRRLIALALFDPDVACMAAAEYGVTPNHFGGAERDIWLAVLSLHAERQSTDPYFVAKRVARDGGSVPEEAVRQYEEDAPRGRNAADSTCQGVIEDYIRERGVQVGQSLTLPTTDPRMAVAEAAHALTELAAVGGRTEGMDDVQARVEAEWEDAFEGKANGLPMPWPNIWRTSGGTHAGGVCLVVGHGGSGKSAIALQWAAYVAKQNIPALAFPLEDGVDEAYKRLSYMTSEADAFRVSIGRCRREDLDRVKTAGKEWREWPLHLHGPSGVDYRTLPAIVQKYVAKHGVRAVFLDAFKDLGSDGSVEKDNAIMAAVTQMAKRWNLYVVLNHHVRKAPSGMDKNEMWYIKKDDLRGTGRIWDDARMVMILQQKPNNNGSGCPFDFALQVAKNNKGRSGFDIGITQRDCLAWVEIVPEEEAPKKVFDKVQTLL